MLGAPAQVVRHGERGVVVEAGDRAVTAGRAILAVPPAIAGRIGYRPAMPGWRNQLTQRVPMGSAIKVHAIYDEPFWREEGLSGLAVSDHGPVRVVYDNSPEDGSPGVLVGFIEGEQARAWARRDRADRRAGILARLADYFGERAGRPRELLERSWADEEYSGGCYAGYFPLPGSGPPSARPFASPCRLHWAGTETATDWSAYMEGRRAEPARGPSTRCSLPGRPPAEVVPGQAGQGASRVIRTRVAGSAAAKKKRKAAIKGSLRHSDTRVSPIT